MALPDDLRADALTWALMRNTVLIGAAERAAAAMTPIFDVEERALATVRLRLAQARRHSQLAVDTFGILSARVPAVLDDSAMITGLRPLPAEVVPLPRPHRRPGLLANSGKAR
ncbi:hypothetical protein [Methylobacterium oryzisoli]|uniref:hypothetical protein n=1 Tax=Methylobacterium oryzisoli TaxID=3385502 RepID=UPI0038929ED1